MNTNISAFAATETGYNHIKIDKVCEDASDYYDDDRMHICVVADGHGSDNYPRTDRGARYAVNAAISCITDFVENADPQMVLEDERHNYELLLQLAKSILNTWHQAVEDDCKNHPFEKAELEKVSSKYRRYYLSEREDERRIEKAYGCTLIAYVVTDSYSIGMHIGDGKCVVVDAEGNITEPIPWDDDCQQNVTTSICDSDAIDEFRFYISPEMPTAVFCGSDGIDDSYAGTEELHAFYRSIMKICVENGVDVGWKEIKEYLPVLTRRGSGDDVSVGLILNMDQAVALAPLMEIQSRLYQVTNELESKRHELITSAEKKDMLSARLQQLERDGKLIADIATRMDGLTKRADVLRVEIAELEIQVQELTRRQQELIYDHQVASFDEPIHDEVIDGPQESLVADTTIAECVDEPRSCDKTITSDPGVQEETTSESV